MRRETAPGRKPLMTLHDRIERAGTRKLLAIDGGGIRGVLSLEVLQRVETILKEQNGGGDDFRLADYFDYIAGTSTGGIIAAGLSIGLSVEEVLRFYTESGAQMFVKPISCAACATGSRTSRWRSSSRRCSEPIRSSGRTSSRPCCCWSCAMRR